ncbi:MAG: hypothetical protein OXU36_11510 [Candidatus Poribacteria bacterium]|nr:hypothetical protein [Candidatus Poribacteria bacterium]
MFRDILSGSRAIFIGLVFFVLVVGGSLLYSWQVHRTTDAEVAATQRKVQPLKNNKAARTAQDTVDTSTVDFEHVETPLETGDTQMSDDTEALPVDEISEVLDMADAFLPDGFVSEEEITEDVPVSPFGFGPYPEIPADFPEPDIFDILAELGTSDAAKALELQKRVILKFWEQGVSLEGVGVSGDVDGKVYLIYPDVVYVKWDYYTDEEGVTHKYAGLTRGHPDYLPQYESYLDRGETPPGVILYELPDGYLDAYDFLGLTR